MMKFIMLMKYSSKNYIIMVSRLTKSLISNIFDIERFHFQETDLKG